MHDPNAITLTASLARRGPTHPAAKTNATPHTHKTRSRIFRSYDQPFTASNQKNINNPLIRYPDQRYAFAPNRS